MYCALKSWTTVPTKNPLWWPCTEVLPSRSTFQWLGGRSEHHVIWPHAKPATSSKHSGRSICAFPWCCLRLICSVPLFWPHSFTQEGAAHSPTFATSLITLHLCIALSLEVWAVAALDTPSELLKFNGFNLFPYSQMSHRWLLPAIAMSVRS